MTRVRPAPKLRPFQAIIDQVLGDDEAAPPKQRHTAAQLFRRLRNEHGYAGGYAQVQRYVRKHRPRRRETFIPLGHLPGRRLEADFGHIHVDFPDGRRPVPFLVAAWAYSNAPFVLALPFERTTPKRAVPLALARTIASSSDRVREAQPTWPKWSVSEIAVGFSGLR